MSCTFLLKCMLGAYMLNFYSVFTLDLLILVLQAHMLRRMEGMTFPYASIAHLKYICYRGLDEEYWRILTGKQGGTQIRGGLYHRAGGYHRFRGVSYYRAGGITD